MQDLIFKILRSDEWDALRSAGRFDGSADDLRDGYMHFSALPQVRETVRKYFAGERCIVLAAVPGDALADGLRWEASRGGQLFPHLYGRPLVPGDIAADIALDPQAVIAMTDADLAALFPRPATAAHRPL